MNHWGKYSTKPTWISPEERKFDGAVYFKPATHRKLIIIHIRIENPATFFY